jgi:superoxide reductase
MTKRNQVYKCSVCGNMVEMLHAGAGELVCCGQPMNLQEEKTQDQGLEKHVPVIEKLPEGGTKVKVGDVPHPMEEGHYIEWIVIKTADGKYHRKFLTPTDAPEAIFETDVEVVEAREYCNLHGVWKA